MIKAEITMGNDFVTNVTGNTIEEIINKIKEFHTLTDFEKDHYRKKGTLGEISNSGWYMKEST